MKFDNGFVFICCVGELGVISLGWVFLIVLSLFIKWLYFVLGMSGLFNMW